MNHQPHTNNSEKNFAKTANDEPKQTTQKPTILLVEDNDLIELCHRKYCEQLNCHVITATNGFQALDRYLSAKPHLILLDIGLPHMSGIEVCRAIRAQEKNCRIPIIAVTACGEFTEEKCRAVSVNDFVEKPVMPEKLKQLLHHWLPEFRAVIQKIKKSNNQQ